MTGWPLSATGAWQGAIISAVAFLAGTVTRSLIIAWTRGRELETEAARDKSLDRAGDWERLRLEIKRLDERCDHLQKEVDECRDREHEWMQRAIQAEAAHLGKGDANQAAQVIISTERQIDAAARKIPRKPGLRRDKP